MAFKVKNISPDFKRLESTLVQTDTQTKNNPLYQVIKRLIELCRREQETVGTSIGSIEETINNNTPSGGNADASLTYITAGNEAADLPNSRQLLAGDFIVFDTTTPNQLTVSGVEWSVLTDGDLIEPELIFASGDVIMTHTP
jgi:hypothetical protein